MDDDDFAVRSSDMDLLLHTPTNLSQRLEAIRSLFPATTGTNSSGGGSSVGTNSLLHTPVGPVSVLGQSGTLAAITPGGTGVSSATQQQQPSAAGSASAGSAGANEATGPEEAKIWLSITRQPKETDNVVQTKYFDLEIALVDKQGQIMRDVVNQLQLKIMLLYEDLSWVDRQELLEIDPKTPPIVDREGYAKVRVRIMEISRAHSRRRFVIYVTAANETLTLGAALSRPLFVLSRKPKSRKFDDGPPKPPLEYPDASIAQQVLGAAEPYAAAASLRSQSVPFNGPVASGSAPGPPSSQEPSGGGASAAGSATGPSQCRFDDAPPPSRPPHVDDSAPSHPHQQQQQQQQQQPMDSRPGPTPKRVKTEPGFPSTAHTGGQMSSTDGPPRTALGHGFFLLTPEQRQSMMAELGLYVSAADVRALMDVFLSRRDMPQ